MPVQHASLDAIVISGSTTWHAKQRGYCHSPPQRLHRNNWGLRVRVVWICKDNCGRESDANEEENCNFGEWKHYQRISKIKMAELLLDSAIRVWVILPIVLITFFVGIIRHYLSILLQSNKKLELEQVSDGQVLLRSKLLREHGCYIPKQAFQMRRHFFNDEEEGFFKTQKRKGVAKNPMSDPTMMVDMAKGNLTNVLPMILIGGWINWHFSGFITTKVPFPLTIRFKAMLQRGVDLASLNASWVSSVSWYFINVFGLRSMYSLVLGENNAADSTRAMQEQMQMSGAGMPPDPTKAFKAEWEALEIVSHGWLLDNVEEKLMKEYETVFEEKDKQA